MLESCSTGFRGRGGIRIEPGFLNAFDQRDPAFVDRDLHRAEAEILDLAQHDIHPFVVGCRIFVLFGIGGRGGHGVGGLFLRSGEGDLREAGEESICRIRLAFVVHGSFVLGNEGRERMRQAVAA